MDQSSRALFALLAEKQIKRGAHKSVKELIVAIKDFIQQSTKSADDILASIDRFCRRTLEAHAPNG